MTPDLTRIQDGRTPVRAAPRWGGGDALHGTAGWYWDASGGFIPGTPDTWNPQVAFLVFPRITSSPRIERRAMKPVRGPLPPHLDAPRRGPGTGTADGALGQQVRTRPHPASLPPHGLRLAR